MNTQVDEERPGEDDAGGCEAGAPDAVAGEKGRCVLRVREGNIDEKGLHGKEMADGEDADAHKGDRPVDVGVSGPGEGEEANGEEEGADDGGDETVFLFAQAVLDVVRDHVEVDIGKVSKEGDRDTD